MIQWIVTAASRGIMKDAEKDGRIAEFVVMAEAGVKSIWPDKPKEVRQMIVQYVIFPFVRLWMKDDPNGLIQAKKESGL